MKAAFDKGQGDIPGLQRNSLGDLEVLVLDCQTTGATPRSGRLLEVGWALFQPSSGRSVAPETHLIRSAEGDRLPAAIEKLTGIQPDEMARACGAPKVWKCLSRAACEVGRRSGGSCIAVIHFARFENAFLQPWHTKSAPGTPLPFETLCTHELARKLLPDLPRCGLRALAGYFGMRLPAEKRCAPHIAATALIWENLLERLAEIGIDDLAGLRRWMRSTPKPCRQRRVYPMPPHLPRRAPDRPGVYRFHRANGDLLYVGKAKSLKQRIGSYFQQQRHSEHILEMLTQAVDLDYAVTATALEAALKEADDVQRMRPEYNIHLQTGGQAPVFGSRDFQSMGAAASADWPMGPFPSQKALQPLGSLVKYLVGPIPRLPIVAEQLATAFVRPSTLMPPPDVFYEGLALFRQQNGLPQESIALARRLLLRGADWWRLARNAKGEAAPAGEPEDFPQTEWRPADVVTLLEGIVLQGAFLARRGRWFTLLSEATMTWETASGGDSLAAIHVRHGRASVIDPPCHPDALPPPERHSRRPVQRQACFDAATYLRMRVLSTELRRLVSEGRKVRVCLRPGVFLDEGALARLFFWI